MPSAHATIIAQSCRVRLLVSAEGTPFELFERIISPEEAQKSAGSTHGPTTTRRDSGSSMQSQHSSFSSSSSSGEGGSCGGGPEFVVDTQLSFVKERAISRLTEMQSIEFQLAWAQQHARSYVAAYQEMAAKQRQQEQEQQHG
jgi:hypothetical protein